MDFRRCEAVKNRLDGRVAIVTGAGMTTPDQICEKPPSIRNSLHVTKLAASEQR